MKNLQHSFSLEFISHGERSDPLILGIPKTLTDEGREEWHTTLVGYFLGKKLPYSLVSSSSARLWSGYGLVNTLVTDNGFYFFSFSSEEQRDAVLVGGPWYIAGRPFILQPWKPSLKLDKEGVHSIPIWVKFYNIPLELWNPKGISFISSFIGKPLRVDDMTASRRRITYARVCIEVSGDQDLIEKLAIETQNDNGTKNLIDINVEYQWLSLRCPKCSTIGHNCLKPAVTNKDFSYHKHPKPHHWVHSVRLLADRNVETNQTNDRHSDEPWTEVTRKGKGKVVYSKNY